MTSVLLSLLKFFRNVFAKINETPFSKPKNIHLILKICKNETTTTMPAENAPAGMFNLYMMMQIFLFCGHPASDVALRFINVQYLSGTLCKSGIYLGKAFRYVFMYRTLTNTKFPCRLPYGRIIVNNIFGYLHSSFLDIAFQKYSPAILVFTLYAVDIFYMQLYNTIKIQNIRKSK